MSESFVYHDPDVLEGLQDEPEQNRRRWLVWAVLALPIVCGLAGAGMWAAAPHQSRGPEVSAEEALLISEPAADEITVEPTREATDVPTLIPTAAPTERPTEAPTSEPTPTPIPVQRPVRQPTAAPSGVCMQNGGLQWTGDICGCGGVVIHVTICMDGAKTDTITNASCEPRSGECQAPPEPAQVREPRPPACRCDCPPPGVAGYCYDTCTEKKCGKQDGK